eukprot:ANDGO_04582.mRNA.1 hypothetical protein
MSKVSFKLNKRDEPSNVELKQPPLTTRRIDMTDADENEDDEEVFSARSAKRRKESAVEDFDAELFSTPHSLAVDSECAKNLQETGSFAMTKVLDAANARKVDRELAREERFSRDRLEEQTRGEFAGKEEFVTSAYREIKAKRAALDKKLSSMRDPSASLVTAQSTVSGSSLRSRPSASATSGSGEAPSSQVPLEVRVEAAKERYLQRRAKRVARCR